MASQEVFTQAKAKKRLGSLEGKVAFCSGKYTKYIIGADKVVTPAHLDCPIIVWAERRRDIAGIYFKLYYKAQGNMMASIPAGAVRTLYKVEGKSIGVNVFYNGYFFTVDGVPHSVNELHALFPFYDDVPGVIRDLLQSTIETSLTNGWRAIAESALAQSKALSI